MIYVVINALQTFAQAYKYRDVLEAGNTQFRLTISKECAKHKENNKFMKTKFKKII